MMMMMMMIKDDILQTIIIPYAAVECASHEYECSGVETIRSFVASFTTTTRITNSRPS